MPFYTPKATQTQNNKKVRKQDASYQNKEEIVI